MKKLIIAVNSFLLCLFIAACFSCGKDPVVTIPEIDKGIIETLPGQDINSVQKDNGAIGIQLDARAIAKKGYQPSIADITVKATTGDFSKMGISIDEYTNMANHSIQVDDLTEAQEKELREGVDLTITIKDANNQVIETEELTKTSFTPSPAEIFLEGKSLTDLTPPVSIRSDVPHYIQIYTEDFSGIRGGINNSNYYRTDSRESYAHMKFAQEINYENDVSTLFYLEQIAGKPGVYSIARHDGNNKHYLHIKPKNKLLGIQNRENIRINGGNTDVNKFPNYQFKIEKKEEGGYTFTPLSTGHPIVTWGPGREGGGLTSKPLDEWDGYYTVYFRIISFDIDWDMQALDTRYEEPILPASNTASAFNSTLKNCSSGSLVQTVGQSESRTSVRKFSWEESMSVATKTTVGLQVTASLEVKTRFFGKPATVGISATGKYEHTKETTATSTRSTGLETKETVTISTERSITVPSKKATQVTDLYQTYENVRIPFVQRFRVRGTYANGSALTGEEVRSQFHFNGFSGVVTDAGPDFIEVTVKGATTVDQLIDTRTSAEDVVTNCGG